MAEERKGGGVKVIDRRWLTPEGEPKEPIPPSPDPPEPEPLPVAEPEQELAAPEPELGARPVRLPQRALLDLVDVLSQYAMAFLSGQVPGIERDPEAARLFIDLLTEVQRRTSATLSSQESKVLDDVLFQLRTFYIAPR